MNREFERSWPRFGAGAIPKPPPVPEGYGTAPWSFRYFTVALSFHIGVRKENEMDRWTEAIQSILDRAPTRARPLSSIVEGLSAAGMPAQGRQDWILKRISELPETFLVISDRRVPWVPWPSSKPDHLPGPSLPALDRDPWVVSKAKPTAGFGSGEETVRRIREGLHAMGAGVDSGSQVSVGRWIRANREGERACQAILSGESGAF